MCGLHVHSCTWKAKATSNTITSIQGVSRIDPPTSFLLLGSRIKMGRTVCYLRRPSSNLFQSEKIFPLQEGKLGRATNFRILNENLPKTKIETGLFWVAKYENAIRVLNQSRFRPKSDFFTFCRASLNLPRKLSKFSPTEGNRFANWTTFQKH